MEIRTKEEWNDGIMRTGEPPCALSLLCVLYGLVLAALLCRSRVFVPLKSQIVNLKSLIILTRQSHPASRTVYYGQSGDYSIGIYLFPGPCLLALTLLSCNLLSH